MVLSLLLLVLAFNLDLSPDDSFDIVMPEQEVVQMEDIQQTKQIESYLTEARTDGLTGLFNRRAFGWQIDMSIAPDILLSAIAFAIGAALLAGIYPALRAARSEPAAAMREE